MLSVFKSQAKKLLFFNLFLLKPISYWNIRTTLPVFLFGIYNLHKQPKGSFNFAINYPNFHKNTFSISGGKPGLNKFKIADLGTYKSEGISINRQIEEQKHIP